MKFLQFRFLPASSDLALLILRLWIGLSMLLLHGFVKAQDFAHTAANFKDPLHIGTHASLILCLSSEIGGSILLILGLFTRLGAFMGIVNLGVAFYFVHHLALKGAHSGELAFIYLAGYFALFFAGGGSFSLDRSLGAK